MGRELQVCASTAVGALHTKALSEPGPHRKKEEELCELPLGKEEGQVAHGVGAQGSDVGVAAGVLLAHGSHPLDHIVGDLQRGQQRGQLLQATWQHHPEQLELCSLRGSQSAGIKSLLCCTCPGRRQTFKAHAGPESARLNR